MDSTNPQRHRPGQRSKRARLTKPIAAPLVKPADSAADLDAAALIINRRASLFLVPQGWGRVHKVEDPSEAARAGRMKKNQDQHLAMQLEASVARSTTWEKEVKPDLWAYGVRVLPKKIRTGVIFTMMAEVRGPRAADLTLPLHGPEMSREEAYDLASDAVEWALKSFREVLLDGEGGWRPDGGASFRTYFIGKCCHGFAGVYRRWLRQRAKFASVENVEALFDDKVPVARDRPDQAAIINLQIEHYLEGCEGELELAIARLNLLEFPNGTIAKMLGVTDKVVEYRLRKNALGAERRWDRGEGETVRGNAGQVA